MFVSFPTVISLFDSIRPLFISSPSTCMLLEFLIVAFPLFKRFCLLVIFPKKLILPVLVISFSEVILELESVELISPLFKRFCLLVIIELLLNVILPVLFNPSVKILPFFKLIILPDLFFICVLDDIFPWFISIFPSFSNSFCTIISPPLLIFNSFLFNILPA